MILSVLTRTNQSNYSHLFVCADLWPKYKINTWDFRLNFQFNSQLNQCFLFEIHVHNIRIQLCCVFFNIQFLMESSTRSRFEYASLYYLHTHVHTHSIVTFLSFKTHFFLWLLLISAAKSEILSNSNFVMLKVINKPHRSPFIWSHTSKVTNATYAIGREREK